MTDRNCDAVIIGGGAAGAAAAAAIRDRGLHPILVEREHELGGILNQCIHNGFGVTYFKEELTGPEFAERFRGRLAELRLDVMTETTAMAVDPTPEGRYRVRVYSRTEHVVNLNTEAVIIATGCRERNRGNITIAGTRPAGVFTAGLAQRLVNMDGVLPGRRAVIIGSGDIGLIMARRLTWVGADVQAVIEIQPYPSGLTRNIVQCLNDFQIPLHLSHVVTAIHGRDRVEGIDVAPLANGIPDTAAAFRIDCDTVLLSVGLVPDTSLAEQCGIHLNRDTHGALVDANLMTEMPGIFTCGNGLHVHDLVDYAVEEAERCGGYVCDYIDRRRSTPIPPAPDQLPLTPGANVRYTVPGAVERGRDNRVYLRSLIVQNPAYLRVNAGDQVILRKKLNHVQPSEMIHLTVKETQITSIPADTPLTINIDEAGHD